MTKDFDEKLQKKLYFTFMDGYKDSLKKMKEYENKYNITSKYFLDNFKDIDINSNDKDDWYFLCIIFKMCGGEIK